MVYLLNYYWLMVYLCLWKIWVRWDYDITNWMESHKIHVPNHQSAIKIIKSRDFPSLFRCLPLRLSRNFPINKKPRIAQRIQGTHGCQVLDPSQDSLNFSLSVSKPRSEPRTAPRAARLIFRDFGGPQKTKRFGKFKDYMKVELGH